MQFLIILIICVVTTIAFLTDGNRAMRSDGWLPNELGYLPELLGLIVIVFVIILGVRNRFQYVRPAYWLTFAGIVVCILSGIVVNAVEPGPIFAGLRNYLKAIPIFFLPAVYLFRNRDVRTQLFLLVGIALIQVPLAFYQRFETRSMGSGTGDWTAGTFMISSIMSTFLICCVCVLAAFYLRKKLSLRAFILLTLILLAPTTVNETKGTLLLLPLGLSVVFLFGAEAGARVKNFAVIALTVAGFSAIFIPIYDEFISDKREDLSLAHFLDRDVATKYLVQGAEVGETERVRRGDAVIVPVTSLASDPVKLVFGLGIGNVSESALGDGFTGRYFSLYAPFLLHVFATLILELGVLGTGLVFLLYWLVFRDAWLVAKSSTDIKATLALGWLGITVIMAAGMFYKQYMRFDSMSFLFWFYAGVVAAERIRMARSGVADGSRKRQPS